MVGLPAAPRAGGTIMRSPIGFEWAAGRDRVKYDSARNQYIVDAFEYGSGNQNAEDLERVMKQAIDQLRQVMPAGVVLREGTVRAFPKGDD